MYNSLPVRAGFTLLLHYEIGPRVMISNFRSFSFPKGMKNILMLVGKKRGSTEKRSCIDASSWSLAAVPSQPFLNHSSGPFAHANGDWLDACETRPELEWCVLPNSTSVYCRLMAVAKFHLFAASTSSPMRLSGLHLTTATLTRSMCGQFDPDACRFSFLKEQMLSKWNHFQRLYEM